MTGTAKDEIRRYLGRQKQNLKHWVIDPSRYCLELAWIRLSATHVDSKKSPRLVRVALISDRDAPASEEQFNPFAAYRLELRRKLGLISLHLTLKAVLTAPSFILSCFDVIILKLSYRTTAAEALETIRAIRQSAGNKRFIYFDGDDDLCVQWPEILPEVDFYIKNHVFRDRSNYTRRFVGKSNLHDYVHRQYGYSFTSRDYGMPWQKYTMISESGLVPSEQLPKIRLGFNFVVSSKIMNLYHRIGTRFAQGEKSYDITFRGTITSETFVYHLRKDIAPILERLGRCYRVITSTERVPPEEYYRELISSRICVSPFGYGEICWRDFEAILCRSLLIKPDMCHVETNPDIFQAYRTYVPVNWDYTDLEEKCRYYLTNEVERARIITKAFEVIDDFLRNNVFVSSILQVLD
jgi:hypothetical protein